jgi:hypothetical protein
VRNEPNSLMANCGSNTELQRGRAAYAPMGSGRFRGQLYKQSQFRQRARNGKCFVEKELWWIAHTNGRGKTKPICPRCPEMGAPVGMGPSVGADCAKQTQFRRVRAGAGRQLCETNPISERAAPFTPPERAGSNPKVRKPVRELGARCRCCRYVAGPGILAV